MGEPTNLVALSEARERAEQLLSQRYSEDIIDQHELERRIERVEHATTLEEIALVTRDLESPSSASTALARRDAQAMVSPDQVPQVRRKLAVFSEVKQAGTWIPARVNRATSVFGNNVLDFREARLAPGETTVEVTAVFGEVVIVVPPGLPVEMEVSPVFASVDQDDTIGAGAASPDAAHLRVRGTAVFANVAVRERVQGESARAARRRRRRERRALESGTAPKAAPRQLDAPDDEGRS